MIGLEDRETECPQIDDPVQTLTVDGTPVDSSLLKSFFMDRKLLLATILVPLGIAGGVLVGLVLVRRGIGLGLHGILSLGRAAVSPQPDHRRARVRAHRVVDEDGESLEPTDGSAAGDSGADSKLVGA